MSSRANNMNEANSMPDTLSVDTDKVSGTNASKY